MRKEASNTKVTMQDMLKIYDPSLKLRELKDKAEKELGIIVGTSSIRRTLSRMKKHGLIEIDKDNTIHSNELYKGRTTTFYERDKDGRVEKIHHLKVDAKKEDLLAAFEDAIKNMVKEIDPLPEVKCNSYNQYDYLQNVYISTDLHIGLSADKDETGDKDWDLAIAMDTIKNSINFLVENSPNTDTAVIVDLGDMVESDNFQNRTERSGNPLDVAARWSKVMQVAMSAMEYMIVRCLEKHNKVKWINVPGNHDDKSSLAIMWYLQGRFANNPRVEIDTGLQSNKYHRFGNTLIGMNHGYMLKARNAGEIMAAHNESIWSDTKMRYFYLGHTHKGETYDGPLCKVESFRNLAPLNAWAATAYARQAGTMHCITHHKEYGEVNRTTYNVMMSSK